LSLPRILGGSKKTCSYFCENIIPAYRFWRSSITEKIILWKPPKRAAPFPSNSNAVFRTMALQTEFEFTLPNGFVEEDGNVHRSGLMRLATAADEILPQKDPRVQSNPAYLTIIVLARVIVKLGSLPDVNPRVIEGLFVQDLAYLQELYRRINGGEDLTLRTKCPHCQQLVEVSISPGEL
jgi:hypothetical protein